MSGRRWSVPGGADTLIRHAGPADVPRLAQLVSGWLAEKGFETEVLSGAGGERFVRARQPLSWKTAIGATPALEVQLAPDPRGTRVDIRLDKAGGAVWAARYLTYSWVALGVSFIGLKKELEDFLSRCLAGPAGAPAEELTVVAVTETRRSEHPMGTEDRVVDNSANSSPVTRTFMVRKRWLQTCQVEAEHAVTDRTSFDAKALDLLSLSSTAERSVRRQYAITTDVEQEYQEEVTLEVPEFRTVTLTISWKRLVQHGEVRMLRSADGARVVVPFAADVGVTFDQRQSER